MLKNLLSSGALTDAQTGVVTFFLGMAIVFLGIAVLVLVVWSIGKIIAPKKVENKKEDLPVKVQETPIEEDAIPDHIKVAITAAIYAYYADQGSANGNCEFIVRKIKRRR